MNCHYCGSDPLKWNVYVKKDGTTRNKQYYSIKKDTIERAWIFANGIDRENNNLGYVIENCVPCCRHCNEMKMDRDTINFLEHVKKINNFQANKK
jgi:5-methylcytosine-specific restriction endonuclease McrA